MMAWLTQENLLAFFSTLSSAMFSAMFSSKGMLESLAVAMGLLYLVLAMKQSMWCWVAAFIGTLIYVYLFWEVALFMDSLLNVYYVGMAIYGAWVWTRKKRWTENIGAAAAAENVRLELTVSTWSWRQHLGALSLVLLLTLVSGLLLQKNTSAAWPFLDSFTTWASVVTTWMVTRKILENWIYWFVIDGVSIVMYIERGLYPTAALFALYTVLCVVGFIEWRKALRNAEQNPPEEWYASPAV